MRKAASKSTTGGDERISGRIRCKNWQRRAAFLKRRGGAQDIGRSAKRNALADTIFVIRCAKDAPVSSYVRVRARARASRAVETRETRREHEIDQKSRREIEAAKRRKKERGGALEEEDSKTTRERERERERERNGARGIGTDGGEVRHAGRYTRSPRMHPSLTSARTNTPMITQVNHARTRATARPPRMRAPPFPLKIGEAIVSSSCSIILLLISSSSSSAISSASSRRAHSRP